MYYPIPEAARDLGELPWQSEFSFRLSSRAKI